MSDLFQIPAHEHGMIRLFTIDLDEPGIEAFTTERPDGWPLREALGATRLNADGIEVFPISDLAGLGLSTYMIDGLGIAEDEIANDRTRLDQITGHILVLLSSSFEGQAQALTPRTPLRWIGTWQEDHEPVKFASLPDASARGEVNTATKKQPSDAAMSGRIATYALLFLFALTGLVIWLAA